MKKFLYPLLTLIFALSFDLLSQKNIDDEIRFFVKENVNKFNSNVEPKFLLNHDSLTISLKKSHKSYVLKKFYFSTSEFNAKKVSEVKSYLNGNVLHIPFVFYAYSKTKNGFKITIIEGDARDQ